MAQYITKIRTESGDVQIDYNGLANLPSVNSKKLSGNITLSASDVGAATSGHAHDDRYYTETEINSKLSGKSDTSHTHTAAEVGAAASGHTHDDVYLKELGLNGATIDNRDGNWTVAISTTTNGTVPSTWVNVTQTNSENFYAQIAVKVNNDGNASRRSGDVWVRDKYGTAAWSKWTKISGNIACCAVNNGTAELLLPAKTITKITLNKLGINNDSFTLSDGGIKMPYEGNILVSGSVYFVGGTDRHCAVFIKNGNTEVATAQFANAKDAALPIGAKIIHVNAGDILTLNARDTDGGNCVPDNAGTHLTVMYV